MDVMPKWAEVILVPLISLLLAAILSGLVILAIGEDPIAAVKLMVKGALGSTYGWGYTLYYATNFMFTGLVLFVAFYARLLNCHLYTSPSPRDRSRSRMPSSA